MPQSKSTASLESLSDLCKQLSQVIKTDPIEKMESQLQSQQQQNQENCRWLDEAMNLLNEVTHIDEPGKAPQIIAKIESFISKADREDYHEQSQFCAKGIGLNFLQNEESISISGCEPVVSSEISKKN